ncbi:F-box/LRR-repeat protein At3g26922 isoform X2 [Medicago truncatula]|uniref:F-box/LRR-repeat protein At3g26922 isoform X2 n=1 Tax=Medicago truncatula TaxID=3880 RepID=UPI000D2F240E|nr:F-box/LRR-repeat protein At3g26922 isoform X2 [Medicago truncatula]
MDTPMAEAAESISDDDGIDRINQLPNSLLHHILSFLPTKTCVQTTPLVSRKWRNLWKNLEALDFCDSSSPQIYEFDNDEQFLIFSVFVNTVLTLRKSRVVRKFCLSCYHVQLDPFYNHSIDTWINATIGPNLEEFHLTLLTAAGFNRVPLSLFSCPNLVSLSFNDYIILQLQDNSKICLPSLKLLQLLDMYNLDLNSVNALLSGCPVLENLEISFAPESLATLRLSSSTLKRLKIDVENEVGAYLEIDAPDLKYLSLTNIMFLNAASVGNLHNVEEAHLDVFSTHRAPSSPSTSESVEPVLRLLQALSGIKHLKLLSSTTKWLFAAPVLDFPEFCHLLYLELWLLSFNSSFLIDMLQKCPVLQTLITFNDKCALRLH